MRSAARDDLWRRVHRDTARLLALISLRYENLPGFPNDTLSFTRPITAICGANGTGKTTLLKSVWAALDLQATGFGATLLRLGQARLNATLLREDKEEQYETDLGTGVGNDLGVVTYIDSAVASMGIQKNFALKEDIEAVLNGVDPIPLDAEQIRNISFLVGKEYDKVEIFEVEEAGDIQPFFRAVEQGISYDSRTMGLGELCILFIFWKLLTVNPNSICLVEEPETFVSPATQASLMDLVASMSTSKRLWIILTTHSPAIIERLQDENIRFLYRHTGQSRLMPQASRNAALKGLGLRPAAKIIVAVEDRVSREFCRLWIGAHDIDLLDRLEIIDVGSASKVTTARNAFPKSKLTRLIGVYDGDQSSVITDAPIKHCFLPGSISVEAMFRQTARDCTLQAAEVFGRPFDLVAATFAELAGVDDHDWLLEFGRRLGLTLEQTLQGLFRCWYSRAENEALSLRAFQRLAELDL
ncbi:MAG: AAA family ATPase [Stellaceae bacterium]